MGVSPYYPNLVCRNATHKYGCAVAAKQRSEKRARLAAECGLHRRLQCGHHCHRSVSGGHPQTKIQRVRIIVTLQSVPVVKLGSPASRGLCALKMVIKVPPNYVHY